MNWEEIKGSWNELKGAARAKWNKLTDDDLGEIGGRKDELLGALQRRYGYEKEEAMRHVDEWTQSLKEKINERPGDSAHR
jgi:uncharacterized protein YjbJ (UPF0337 family)